MPIDVINVRAKIVFKESDQDLVIATPYIQSFSVNKNRGAMSTFSASIKVEAQYLEEVSGEIEIYAGTVDNLRLIFTGFIKRVVPSPVWDDPGYLMLNVTGTDVLYRLENKRFTRRQEYSDSTWATITSVRDGLKSVNMKYAPSEPLMIPTKQGLVEVVEKEATRIVEEPGIQPNSKENPGLSIAITVRYPDTTAEPALEAG